jgi:L-alanine-DL-glutamate epimerase-like enolase superfamily enzyme
MKLSFSAQTLYFKQPFKIAHGIRTSTPIVLTQLEHEGIIGYGEASMPPYLGETQESVCSFLEKAADLLLATDNPLNIDVILSEIDAIAEKNTAAKTSVDIALHDLIGKLKNEPCWKMFDCDKSKTPYTTYTIGIDTKESIIHKVKDAEEYKLLKVKLDGVNDKDIINAIRSVTDKPIAVDVNQGWKDKHHALEMIKWLNTKNVLFVEQPLPKDNFDDAAWLFEKSELPIFADESVQRLTDIDKAKNCFHGINIKLMKCTGINEARKMIVKARALNLQLLIGCMSETSCAISAAAQISPLFDYADLDGALLIKNDLYNGVTFIDGKITLNELPGIGALPVLNNFLK